MRIGHAVLPSRTRRVCTSVLSLLTAFAIFAVTVTYEDGLRWLFAHAASVSDLQEDYEEMEDRLDELKDELDRLQNEETGYMSQISNYNQQIDIIEEQIASADAQIILLTADIESMDVEIAELEEEIASLDEDIAENYEKFKERLRAFHLSGEASKLEILLGSQSFMDFLNRYAIITAVAERDKALMDSLSEEIDAQQEQLSKVEKMMAEVEASRAEAEALRADLDAKSSELEQIKADTQKLLDDIRDDEELTQQAIEELNKDMEALEEEIEEAIRNSTGEYVGGSFTWPCPGYSRISSPFGYRTHPITGEKDKLHKGVDLAAAKNTPILAANSGKVTSAYNYENGSYGKYVIIDHGGGYVTLYAHCNEVLVKKGDVVTKGQQIAKVGTTGSSTGNHLHFEIRIGDKVVDPMDYFPDYD